MSEITLPLDLKAPDGSLVGRIEMGAAEGGQYATIRLFKGDVINVRNVQGGTADSPNLDLGAGDSRTRGNIVLNWDVGNGLEVCDGRKARAFSVNHTNDRHIESRLPHRFYHRPLVRRSDGTWHPL